ASTTGIDLGFATGVSLTPDEKKLYAGYPGVPETLIFDVDRIKQIVEDPANADTLSRQPIDLAFGGVNLPPIEFNGPSARDISFQNPEIIKLAPPVGLTPATAGTLITPTFTWQLGPTVQGATISDVKIYVSTFPQGSGLFPNDSLPGAPAGDSNPTRIL